jgi:hypothetical protein
MDFYSGSNQQYINHLIGGGADILLLQETKDFTLKSLLPSGWKAYQDTSTEAKKNSCLAVNTATVKVDKFWLVKGCDPPPGGGMMTRWLACAAVRWKGGGVFTPISGHAPPPRYSSIQPNFNASLKKVCESNPDPVVGADANQDIDKFAKAIGSGMKAYGKQSGICLVAKSPITDVVQDHWAENNKASDHPAVFGTKG